MWMLLVAAIQASSQTRQLQRQSRAALRSSSRALNHAVSSFQQDWGSCSTSATQPDVTVRQAQLSDIVWRRYLLEMPNTIAVKAGRCAEIPQAPRRTLPHVLCMANGETCRCWTTVPTVLFRSLLRRGQIIHLLCLLRYLVCW